MLWSRQFLMHQRNVEHWQPSKIYQDNQSTIILATKGCAALSRSRHINLRFFHIKDRIASGELHIEYLPTKDMIADILTKPLQGELFRKLRDLLLYWLLKGVQHHHVHVILTYDFFILKIALLVENCI